MDLCSYSWHCADNLGIFISGRLMISKKTADFSARGLRKDADNDLVF